MSFRCKPGGGRRIQSFWCSCGFNGFKGVRCERVSDSSVDRGTP